MAVNSPEYKTIQRHTNDLRLSVKSDLIELSGVLFAVGLINQGKSDRLRFDAVPEDSRAASLIGFIQDKVKEDPQNYNTFVKALENSNSTHYSNILQKLQRSYNDFQLKSGANTASQDSLKLEKPDYKPDPPKEDESTDSESVSDPKQYPTLDSLEVIRVIDESLFKEYPYKLFLKQNHKIFEVAVVIFVMFQVIASVFITMCEGGGLYTVFHHGLNLSEFIHRIIVLLLRILARAVTPWIFYRQLCSMSDSEKALNNKKKKDDYRSPEFKLPHKSVKRLQHNTMESTVSHAILFSIILVFLGAFVTVDSHLKGKSICIKELLQIQIPLVGMQVFAFLDSLATSFILILVGLIKDSYCIENRFCTEYNCEYFAVIRKRWTRLDIFCYIMSSLLILFSVISLFSNRSLTTVPDQQLSSNEFEIWYFWIIVLSLLLFVGSSSNWTAKVIAITGNVLALCCAFCFTLFLGVTKVTFPPGTTIVLVYSYLSATTINFLFCLLKTHYRHKKMKSKHFWLCLLIYVLLSVTFCIVFVREFIFCASFVEWP